MHRIFSVFLLTYGLSMNCFSQDVDLRKQAFYYFVSAAVSIDFPLSNEDGSGFLYRDSLSIYLVTAKHILYDTDATAGRLILKYESCKINFNLNEKDSLLSNDSYVVNLKDLNEFGKIAAVSTSDLAVVKLGEVRKHPVSDSLIVVDFYNKVSRTTSNVPIGLLEAVRKPHVIQADEVYEGYDIFLFGFPNSLGVKSIPQFSRYRPLIRKGLIAQFNPISRRFILDAAAFGGNSGGPVVILKRNNFYFCGIVVENIPVNTYGDYVGNSGYSVMESFHYLEELKAMVDR